MGEMEKEIGKERERNREREKGRERDGEKMRTGWLERAERKRQIREKEER